MTVLSDPLEIDAPSVISDDVGGETLAINLQTGSYFVIPPSCLPVWQALTMAVPAAELLDGPQDPRREALQVYVESLLSAGLLRPAAQSRPLTARPEWRAEDLGLQAHSDMADLLGLDPIHDADENIGWPTVKAEGEAS
jgi:hypothetical protein